MSVLEEEVVTESPVLESPVTEQESCSLDNYLVLPDHSMDERIAEARRKLGKSTILLGHHYQRDEVIRFADYTGDSYKLSKVAAETEAKYLIFCGVHFMAESADILGRPDDPPGTGQQVILPDLNAGCSMADMAEIGQVEACWDTLLAAGIDPGEILPLTYMNSTAAIKAFCGERGGLVCTSSNARKAFEWAFARAEKILFLPDQHLGRNTAFAMDIPLNEMVVFDPYQINGGITPDRLRAAKIILWKGHCSVHQRFLPQHVDEVRAKYPRIKVIVHPECRWEVCQKADAMGSTERLIKLVSDAPEGSMFAIGTEIHLVNRLAKQFAPSGKKSDHPRRYRLPMHYYVSHQPAASRLGAREPARGTGGQPHPGTRRSKALGTRGARQDARDKSLRDRSQLWTNSK